MDFKELEYILVIAREKSISRAAEHLYMSQPALSRFLLKLESRLGVELFIRKNRQYLPSQPHRLDEAAAEGVVAINLTWNHANVLSGAHNDDPERGLSSLGRRFVEKMEELHILVDVSHLSEAGFWDVAEMARRPFMASHSNAKSVWNHTRNLTDGQINAIIKNQGVIGLNFYTGFVGGSQNLDMVRAHLDHILALGGTANIALGGDWDGCDLISELPAIDSLPKLYEHLLHHGYSEAVVQDLFYNNLMRVVSQR